VNAEPAGAQGVCCGRKSCASTEAVGLNQSEVESALTSARAARARAAGELGELEETIIKFEASLAPARAGMHDGPAPTSMTLHEAMRKVLQSVPMRMMHAQDLAAEIGRLHLCRRPNGRAIQSQQIYERTRNYPYLFERAGTFIRLKV